MSAAIISTLAGLFEPLVEKEIAQLPSQIQSLIAALPSSAQPAASPPVATVAGTSNQVAIVARLVKAMPFLTSDNAQTLFAQVGAAVAEAVASNEVANPTQTAEEYLSTPAAMTTITTLVQAGIKADGMDVSTIKVTTLAQILYTGIEMYLAGVGVQAPKA